MKPPTVRPESSGDVDAKQPLLLAKGLYGGMFARYSKPISVPKWKNPDESEMKLAIGFVVTHGINEQPLPRFSEAFAFPKLKRFYDEKKGLSSGYSKFLAALLGGKWTPEQINAASDQELPDLDELIAYPITFEIEPAKTANKNGIYSNIVQQFIAPSAGMKRAIIPLWKERQTAFTEDDSKRVYLTKPEPSFVEKIVTAAQYTAILNPQSEVPFTDAGLDDEVPF